MDIRLIDKDTPIEEMLRDKIIIALDWDVNINGIPYQVYHISGYVHTIGSRWGENCYWACPLDEAPTYQNLIEFNGEPCRFGVNVISENYVKTKYDETSVEHLYKITITRNDAEFYTFRTHDIDWGMAKVKVIQKLLLENLPFSVCDRNWMDQLIGRTIHYKNERAIVKEWCGNLDFYIVPVEGKFHKPEYWSDASWSEYEGGTVINLVESYQNIYWWDNGEEI